MDQHIYYIGIGLSPEITETINTVQRALFDPREVIPPLEPHITLLPPPAVEGIDQDLLADQVRETSKRYLPLGITLQAVASTRSSFRIVIRSNDKLMRLQEELVNLLPEHARPKESFRPHITLAQPKRGKRPSAKLLRAYEEKLQPKLPLSCTIEHLSLYIWQSPRVYKETLL